MATPTVPRANPDPVPISPRTAALSAHAAGLSVLPPRQDGSKAPTADYPTEDGRWTWEPYQRSRATPTHIRDWYRGGRDGVGIVTGRISGHWSDDGKSPHALEAFEFDDAATFAAFLAAAHATGLGLPVERIRAGYEEETPSGGRHWLYYTTDCEGNQKLAQREKFPKERAHERDRIKTLIETRGEGGYLITAPSGGRVHPSGESYRLLSGGFASITDITADERRELFRLARTFHSLAPEPAHREATDDSRGGRPGDDFAARMSWAEILESAGWTHVHDKLWRRPGKDTGWSASVDYAGSDLLYVFSTSTPFEPERGYGKFAAYTILHHAGDFAAAARTLAAQGYGTPTNAHTAGRSGTSAGELGTQRGVSRPLTDLGNAERLAALHGRDLRYVPEWGWLVWDGRRWARDAEGLRVLHRAQETVRTLYAEAEAEPEADRRAAIARHAAASERAPRLAGMVTLARALPAVAAEQAAFNADPFALTVLNGTLDLHNGALRPHARTDYITRLAPVTYDPEARAPILEAFLSRIFNGDAALIAFVQRALGYSLTGDISERVLFIPWGGGANGKTTLLETVSTLLGVYAQRVPTALLLAQRQNGIPNDVARLQGVRLAFASETEDGGRLAEAFIKDLTGGDTLTARFLHREFFDFRPECKVWLRTNHRPRVRGTDDAIWDRIRLIPFRARIPPEERDGKLAEKLRAELPGILNWLLAGCLAWQRDGLGTAQAVADATAQYRVEEDVLRAFLDERCVFSPAAEVPAAELFGAYLAWCNDNHEPPMSQKRLGARLTERGLLRKRGHGGQYRWYDIGLLIEQTDTDASGQAGEPSLPPGEPFEPCSEVFLYGEEVEQPCTKGSNGSPAAPMVHRLPAIPSCYWCKQPSADGAEYRGNWVGRCCEARELPEFGAAPGDGRLLDPGICTDCGEATDSPMAIRCRACLDPAKQGERAR